MKSSNKVVAEPKAIKIELKGLKIFLAGSQETICFVSDVYADGVKFASAENQGHGGCTFVRSYEGKHDLLQKVEAYCASLPGEKSSYENGDGTRTEFVIDMSLEYYIDKLVGEESDKKELERSGKRAVKYMIDHLLFTNLPPEENYLKAYYILSFGKPKRVPIAELLSRPDGIALIKKTVERESAKGARIVNTNIPMDLLK